MMTPGEAEQEIQQHLGATPRAEHSRFVGFAMRRVAGWQEADFRELERLPELERGAQVSEMNWIEGAAEEADRSGLSGAVFGRWCHAARVPVSGRVLRPANSTTIRAISSQALPRC